MENNKPNNKEFVRRLVVTLFVAAVESNSFLRLDLVNIFQNLLEVENLCVAIAAIMFYLAVISELVYIFWVRFKRN